MSGDFPLVFSVTSGKGGVGKTNLSVNLALCLARKNKKVVLIDADLGLANVDVLLGFSPGATLWDVLQGRTTLDKVLHTDVSGLHVLPAASGTGCQAQLDTASCQQLIKSVRPLADKHDFVLLDLGAGLSDTVRLLARACALPLLVTSPEPTAIADAYALIKVLSKSHHIDNVHIVVNNVYSEEEVAMTRIRLVNASKKFLQITPKLLGSIRHDPAVQEAVCRRVPLLRLFPETAAAQDITALAKKLKSLHKKMAAEGLLSPCLTLRRRSPATDSRP